MRILCCLDGANAERMSRTVETLLRAEKRTMAVLYVTDRAPQMQMEQQRERHLRPPHPPLLRQEQMRRAEGMAAQEILEEGVASLGCGNAAANGTARARNCPGSAGVEG